ncbi:MAG: hypothetical protein OXG33_00980 [Chloroflexi bacterium]|nr:hypothetical protein [Chloroflexota bacterium]
MTLPAPAELADRLEPLLDALADHFGPQRWWTDTDPFEVIAGALLVQNTAWTGAAKAIENLRAAGALSVEGILDLDELSCQELVRPSGSFRQKTAKLHAFATHVRDAHDGDLHRMLRTPPDPLRRELLGIWGVGPETADAILLYAARQPSFVVDTYTQRALERLGVIPKDVPRPALRALLLAALPTDAWQLAEAHGLFVRLGKAHCRSTPDCPSCPLLLGCRYGSGGSIAARTD